IPLVPEQILSRALSDDNDGMASFCEALLKSRQESPPAFQLEWDFGNESKVHILARHGGSGGQKTGVTAHDFYQGNTVLDAARLGMCALHDLDCFLHSREIAEAARHERNIVINCLGDTHHGQGMPAFLRFLKEGFRSPLRSITTNSEEDVDPATNQVVHRPVCVHRSS